MKDRKVIGPGAVRWNQCMRPGTPRSAAIPAKRMSKQVDSVTSVMPLHEQPHWRCLVRLASIHISNCLCVSTAL